MASLQPYNISLNSSSSTFIYRPFRDGFYGLEGDPAGGWRSSFSNITTWPIAGLNNIGNGVPFRETYLDGANVTLEFEGTAVYLCIDPHASSFFEFTVDQQPIETIGSGSDPVCAHTGATQMAYASGLTYGNHSANVRVNAVGSDADFFFYGGIVTIGISGTNATTVGVDDADPGWNYSPGNGIWSFSSVTEGIGSNHGSNYYNGTAHWTCRYGPSYTASYTFNGSSAVQLLGLCNLNVGPYTIQLDDRSYVYNASDFWRQSQQVLFFAGNLDPTQAHTIRVMNFDAAAPDAQQPVGDDYYPCVAIDELVLTKTTPHSTPPSTPDTPPSSAPSSTPQKFSTPVAPIAGGVVGGVAALAALVFLLWLFVWRSKRRDINQPDLRIVPFNPAMVEPAPYSLSNHTYTSIRSEDAAAGVGQTSGTLMYQLNPGRHAGTPSPAPPIGLSNPALLPSAQRRHQQKVRRELTMADQRPSLSHPSSTQPPVPPTGTGYPEPSTAELVDLLNQRLRAEYRAEEGLDPPNYEPVD